MAQCHGVATNKIIQPPRYIGENKAVSYPLTLSYTISDLMFWFKPIYTYYARKSYKHLQNAPQLL